MLITDFARKHQACPEGVRAAMDLGCKTMEQIWAHPEFSPEDRIWTATRPGVLTDKELRLFAVWAARQVQHLMEDPRSKDALDVAERYANGEATDEELAAAGAAAWDAKDAARDAWAAAGTDAWDARAAARAAGAAGAAGAAAWAAAWAAGAAAWAAAWAAGAAQSKWLQGNVTPKWEE
jgi:hypothetical protein